MKIPSSLFLSLFLAATPAFAQTVWTGANLANWGVGGNWNTGAVPTSGNVIVNGVNGPLVDDDRSGGTIGVTFLGIGTGNGRLEVTTGGSLKVGSLLLGRDTARAGTLTMSGGALTVSQLAVGDGRGNASGGSGTATISAGSSVTVSSSFTIGASANGTTTGTVTVNGGTVSSLNLRVGDAGAGTLVQNDGTFTVTGTEFLIANNSTQNSVMNLQGGTMTANSATIQVGGTGSGTGALNLSSGATLNAAGVLVRSSSTFTDQGGTLNVTGGITNNGTWVYNMATDFTRSYIVGGSGGLDKSGAGVLTLAAANTYAGPTTLVQGNIRLGITDAISTSSVLMFGANANARRLSLQGFNQTLGGVDSTLATGGTLILESATDDVSDAPATLTLNVATGTNYTFGGLVRNASGTAVNSALSLVKSGAGTQVLSGATNQVTYSGSTTVNGGVLEFAGANSVANNSAITLGGGTVRFSGGGTRSNTISGSGTLEKSGANSLTLTGNNTFAGATTISNGTLELARVGGPSLGSTTSVSVASGATLLVSQSDQVSNTAAVSLSGGTIQRGAGVSEVFGNLNLTTGSFLDFGTGTTGNLTFGTYQNNEATPSALLTLNNFLPGNSFTFSSTSFSTNSVGSYFTFGTGYAGSSIANTGSTFTITAIPEPTTYLAAAGLLGLLASSLRRRTASRSPQSPAA